MEARVGAEGVPYRVGFERNQPETVVLVGLFQPSQRLLLLIKASVYDRKSRGWHDFSQESVLGWGSVPRRNYIDELLKRHRFGLKALTDQRSSTRPKLLR